VVMLFGLPLRESPKNMGLRRALKEFSKKNPNFTSKILLRGFKSREGFLKAPVGHKGGTN
jgi:hypothetical protein